MKINKLVLSTFIGILSTTSTIASAEKVISMTIEDVGSGATGNYSATLDTLAGRFAFSSVYTTPGNFDNFTTDVSAIDTSVANSVGSVSSGFDFGADQTDPGSVGVGQFVPYTDGPIVADIVTSGSTVSLNIDSNDASLPWRGLYQGNIFPLHPFEPTDPAVSLNHFGIPGFNVFASPCGISQVYQELKTLWVNKRGETDTYNYAIEWTSCILGTGTSFDGQVAGWHLEGVMTVEDTVAPVLSSGTPAITGGADSAIDLPVSVTFNEPMDVSTVTTTSFSVAPTSGGGANKCTSIVASNNNKTFSCVPTGAFSISTNYTVNLANTIRDDAAVPVDRSAYPFAGASYTFNSIAAESIPPTVVSAPNASNVANNAVLQVVFDEPMASTTSDAISLLNGTDVVDATVTADALSEIFTITPTAGLLNNNTTYTIRVTTTAADSSLNLLATEFTSNFTTETATTTSGNGATLSIDAPLGESVVYVTQLTAGQAGASTVDVGTVQFVFSDDDQFIDYVINNVTGTEVKVTLTFSNSVAGKQFVKIKNSVPTLLVEGTANDQYQRVLGNDNQIVMTVTDDGPLDLDVGVNPGTIHDPIGTATNVNDIPQPGSLGGGWWLMMGLPILLLMRYFRV